MAAGLSMTYPTSFVSERWRACQGMQSKEEDLRQGEAQPRFHSHQNR